MQTTAALKYREFEKRQAAEGMSPNMFNSTANLYFEQRMNMFEAMDYDEMLSRAERLLATNERAKELARRYHAHVLVDEFQVLSTTSLKRCCMTSSCECVLAPQLAPQLTVFMFQLLSLGM